MNNNTLNSKDVFLKYIFILNALIYIIKYDNSLCTPTYDDNSPNQTRIELIETEKSDYHLSSCKCQPSPKRITHLPFTTTDLSYVNRVLLIQFHNLCVQHFKSIKNTYSPFHLLISILQKNNIWHQSSDEDSHRLS